jgi:DNA-binding XRE family transcriptional regulator
MDNTIAERFGANLKILRLNADITQASLARQTSINRTKIVRMEAGEYVPQLDEALQIAEVLKAPLQQLLTGTIFPSIGLKGIAFELYHLGIRDYVVEGAVVPGAFRRPEQIVALTLKGDRPETRVIDAMPLVLASYKLNVSLTLAYADIYDRRVRARLAWLSDVTLSLGRLNTFPVPLRTQEGLEKFTKKVKRPDEPDSLGRPSVSISSPIWRRWNITYGGTLSDFLARVQDLAKTHRSGEDA